MTSIRTNLCFPPPPSLPVRVFMIPKQDFILWTSLEGFLYGIYSGILVIYFQCQSNKSTGRTTTIVVYPICLLYVLSTVNFVSDLVAVILESRNINLPFSLEIVQAISAGCCDFLAQCILIYRCWVVWGQNIRVVVIPSFLAVAYLATWAVPPLNPTWTPLTTTSLAATMTVNGLVTGLIVFRILKVFLQVKAATTSIEQTLGSTGGTKFRHIIFIIIESGMTLFVIQLIRLVFEVIAEPKQFVTAVPVIFAVDYVLVINEMFNGITPTIILVRISMKMSFDNEESLNVAVGSLYFNNPPSDPTSLQRMGSMLPQDSERNEDICYNNPPSASDPNVPRQLESSSIVEL